MHSPEPGSTALRLRKAAAVRLWAGVISMGLLGCSTTLTVALPEVSAKAQFVQGMPLVGVRAVDVRGEPRVGSVGGTRVDAGTELTGYVRQTIERAVIAQGCWPGLEPAEDFVPGLEQETPGVLLVVHVRGATVGGVDSVLYNTDFAVRLLAEVYEGAGRERVYAANYNGTRRKWLGFFTSRSEMGQELARTVDVAVGSMIQDAELVAALECRP